MTKRNNQGDFVSAGSVYFGNWMSLDDVVLPDERTPEQALIKKDSYFSMSDECKTLVDILFSLPEEFFLLNGKVKNEPFRHFVRKQTGWSLSKVDAVKQRLRNFLTNGEKFS